MPVIAYLKFLLKSTNQHGVHSPFVFSLVTKCIYDHTKYPEYKTLRHRFPYHSKRQHQKLQLFFRLGNYFNIKTALITTQNDFPEIETALSLSSMEIKIYPLAKLIPDEIHTTKTDLIYFDSSIRIDMNYCLDQLYMSAQNDTLLVLDNIHQSKETEKKWETIKALPEVTVTIDTFFLGMVFFRKEQVKEHFVIRL